MKDLIKREERIPLSGYYRRQLEHVITLATAKHYGFTTDDLKDKKGLKEFFGFK